MAKKVAPKAEVKPTVVKVYSDKYGCLITKSEAIFDDVQNSWINLEIENNLIK